MVFAALGASSCTHGTSTSAPGPACGKRLAAGTLSEARNAAVSYVDDVAAHRYTAAEHATEPCDREQYGQIRKLWKFMAGMPTGSSRVTATARKGSVWPGSAEVTATVYMRFGHLPYTSWITAATRTLRLDSRPGGWRITTDTTKHQQGKLSAYGFQSYARPVVL
jgi:hypothetical protein